MSLVSAEPGPTQSHILFLLMINWYEIFLKVFPSLNVMLFVKWLQTNILLDYFLLSNRIDKRKHQRYFTRKFYSFLQIRIPLMNSCTLTLLHTAYLIPLCHRGADSTPQLENTLGGVWDQLFFYRIINIYKTRQNPKVQTSSFENGALKNYWKAKFFTLSEMPKIVVSGKNLCHSLKFWPFDP